MVSVAAGGVAAAGAESAGTFAVRCIGVSSSNVATWSMSACFSGGRSRALDSRLSSGIVLRGTREEPTSARSSGRSPASRPEPALEARVAPVVGAASTDLPPGDFPAVARSPGVAAPDWELRDSVLSLLLPDPSAGARPTSRPSVARCDSAERRACASSPTSSVVPGGSASGIGRSPMPDGVAVASCCREEGARSGSASTSIANAVHSSIERSGRAMRVGSRLSSS